MFNTLKKAVKGIFRPSAKRTRPNVIALPTVAPVKDDEQALTDARRSLINTLEQILFVETNNLTEQVVDLLDRGSEDDEFDADVADAIVDALEQLGIADGTQYFDNDDWHALTAAVEYYSGICTVDLQKAVEVVASGAYRYYRDVDDETALGWKLVEEWLTHENVRDFLPDWLEGAIDFEAIGRDAVDDFGYATNAGKFTSNGYFRPLD